MHAKRQTYGLLRRQLGIRFASTTSTYKSPLRIPTIRQLLLTNSPGESTRVQGWVRSVRTQKHITFAEVNDGTSLRGIQVVVDKAIPGLVTGSAVQIDGILVASPGKEQSLELRAANVSVVGHCDTENYPLQKKRHTLEFLREWPHLRARTRTLGAVTRVRNEAIQQLHCFFQSNDFLQVNTPILTTHDCEGGGEAFRVQSGASIAAGTDRTDSEFFGQPTFLTVSGQLHLEALASAASRVYTLSPTFRAEPSQTSRHLAEFWMLEAEIAFVSELEDLLAVCETCLVETTAKLREKLSEDIELFGRWVDRDLYTRLDTLSGQKGASFARLTYTEAIDVLQRASVSFQYSPNWGAPLQSEHERYLADVHCQRPVFVTDYPAAIKPFYMLTNRTTAAHAANTSRDTVACMDLLVPGVGELIGGSLRESDEARLTAKMLASGIDPEAHAWYRDLRRFGGAPHGGFGLGLERYLLAITGIGNLKDLIPMPRFPGHCRC